MKICKTYSHYNKVTRNAIYNESYNLEALKQELTKMLRDESHVTIKLRRALYFLKYDIYSKIHGDLINPYDVFASFMYWKELYNSMKMHIEDGHLYANMPDGWSEEDMPRFDLNAVTGELSTHLLVTKNKPLPLFYIEE